MKLSSALLLNGMSKPQGMWNSSVTDMDAPCAIGGALQVIGRQAATDRKCYRNFAEAWPWTKVGAPMVRCPICTYYRYPMAVIFHLNDEHKWTRTKIAEWVATVEPQESVTSSADENQDDTASRENAGQSAPVSALPVCSPTSADSLPSEAHQYEKPLSMSDVYSVSEHAFEHSEHVMGRGNVNG